MVGGTGIVALEAHGGIISEFDKEVEVGDEVEDKFADVVEVILVVYRLNEFKCTVTTA